MPSKSFYFLYGYFGTGNFGDDILLYAAIENILKNDPDATFLIRNHGTIDLEKKFPGRIECTNIEDIHHTNKNKLVKFLTLLKSYWTCMGRASTLVVGGGTLIHDVPNLKSTFLLLCLCLIAKIRGRCIFGIGLGAQNLQSRSSKIIAKLLAKLFDRLCLRDERSYEQFKKLSKNAASLSLTADLAYTLPKDEVKQHKDKIIAVTLAACLIERVSKTEQQEALKTLAYTLSMLIKEGYHIRLISLQAEKENIAVSGDAPFLKQLQEYLPEKQQKNTKLIQIEATPESIKNAYDGVCLTMGMRFHSLIFSAMKTIPFIGLSDEPKISALCDEFSMPCYPIDHWSDESLLPDIRKTIMQEICTKTLNKFRERSLDNFRFSQK